VGEIEGLNSTRSESVSYKVFFLGRHGEGNHNVAESKYGQKAWDEYVLFVVMSPLAAQASDEGNGPYLTGMVNLYGDLILT